MNLLRRLFPPTDALKSSSTRPGQVGLKRSSEVDLAWNLMVELRKEMVEAQKIRSQIIGVKITFVSAGVGVIAANIDTVPVQLLVIPALAAILFDLLISSYGFSIKCIGYYCRSYIEPRLKKAFENSDSPGEMLLWEEFVARGRFRQPLFLWGNLGLTGLAIILAVIALLTPFDTMLSLPLLVVIAVFFLYDIVSFRRTDKIGLPERAD